MVVSIGTGNRDKAALFKKCFDRLGIESVTVPLQMDELQADDFVTVVRDKALQARTKILPPYLVEDAGLAIGLLNGFPGPATRYVLKTIGARGLVKLAASAPCIFESVTAIVDVEGNERLFVDRMEGEIATTIGGTAPNSWSDLWQIFVPKGQHHPYSALEPEVQIAYLNGREDRVCAWIKEVFS